MSCLRDEGSLEKGARARAEHSVASSQQAQVGVNVRCGSLALVVGVGVLAKFAFSQQAQVGVNVPCALFALVVG